MDVFRRVAGQMETVGLPLFTVTLTAVPRANTPILPMLYWHGSRRNPDEGEPRGGHGCSPVPAWRRS